tara:strand:+ start:207 stop:1040 length:834 start_codon:yes stop_codon:yes gene_type:complete
MLKNKFLFKSLAQPILSRNKKFLNIHKNKTCYIFGNGASIKNLDLKDFSDLPTIGINHLCLHKDFKYLDTKYYVLPESFFFYPYKKNIYTGKRFEENIMGKLFKKSFNEFKKINLFTSLTNFFGAQFPNVYYIHHFGYKLPDIKYNQIDSIFSFMSGGLNAAIGLAINLGFSKAYLVGCDYLFSPVKYGHFYDFGPPQISTDKEIYPNLIHESSKLIKLCVITDKGISNHLDYIEYTDYKSKKINYKENTEIIKSEYLKILDKAHKIGLHTNKIFNV